MPEALIETVNLTVRFGGHVAVGAVTCAFRSGELTGIVGPNGTGKTTDFDLISGQIATSAGRVKLDGRDVIRMPVALRCRMGLGRAFQLTNLFRELAVIENVRLVVQSKARIGFRLFSRADAHHELACVAEEIVARVRLDRQARQAVSVLSHDDQRKLEVALLIALDPKVYMFDEPTAGMSLKEAPVVLDLFAGLKKQTDRTTLLVEHKMDVIGALADRIVVLHSGRLAADGAPDEVMASAVVQEAYMGKELADV